LVERRFFLSGDGDFSGDTAANVSFGEGNPSLVDHLRSGVLSNKHLGLKISKYTGNLMLESFSNLTTLKSRDLNQPISKSNKTKQLSNNNYGNVAKKNLQRVILNPL